MSAFPITCQCTNPELVCRGGMLFPAKQGVTEEDYYFAEWTAAEKENGDHRSVMKFVSPFHSLIPPHHCLSTAS